jgi:hypothetical protein
MKKILILLLAIVVACGIFFAIRAQDLPEEIEPPEASQPDPEEAEETDLENLGFFCGDGICEPDEICPEDCGVDDVAPDGAIPPSLVD